ncbi:MAG: hypothetical protein WDN45_03465 [Caulobacteraceae bacterium]
MTNAWPRAIAATALLSMLGSGLAQAQVPEPVYQALKTMARWWTCRARPSSTAP